MSVCKLFCSDTHNGKPSEHGQILQNTVMSMKDKKQVASTMIRHMPTGMGGRTSRDAVIGGVE